jgi:hypothetical protein
VFDQYLTSVLQRAFAEALAPMERWEREGGLPDLRKHGEDSWEDQVGSTSG